MSDMSDEFIADMMEDGSILSVEVSDEGEFFFTFNEEVLSTLHPAVYSAVRQVALVELWVENQEYVERHMINGEPYYELTEKGKKYIADN